MITYKGATFGYLNDSERKYWEDSDCNILIFNWERWCFHETDWCTFPNTNTTKVNVDKLIEEIKKYDICFFVISEMINQIPYGEDNSNLPTILTLFEEMSKLNVVYLCLSEDSNFPIDKSKSLNMPWFTDKKIYISENTTSDFDYRQKDLHLICYWVL